MFFLFKHISQKTPGTWLGRLSTTLNRPKSQQGKESGKNISRRVPNKKLKKKTKSPTSYLSHSVRLHGSLARIINCIFLPDSFRDYSFRILVCMRKLLPLCSKTRFYDKNKNSCKRNILSGFLPGFCRQAPTSNPQVPNKSPKGLVGKTVFLHTFFGDPLLGILFPFLAKFLP